MLRNHHHPRIQLSQPLLDGAQPRVRIPSYTHQKRLIRRQHETVWGENGWFYRMVQSIVSAVAHDSDDFQPVIRRLREEKRGLLDLEHRSAHSLANRICVAHELLPKR